MKQNRDAANEVPSYWFSVAPMTRPFLLHGQAATNGKNVKEEGKPYKKSLYIAYLV
jgi:hypothetical protein